MGQNTQIEMLSNRLRKNAKHLAKWRKREAVTCYRLYDADIPEFSLAIDVYTDINEKYWVHAQEYEAPRYMDETKTEARFNMAIRAIKETLDVDDTQLHAKVRRQQKGSQQYEKLAENKEFIQVRENGCLFWVNLTDYLDTGLFLDHRTTRGLLRSLMSQMPGEKHFLNLFAYTGTATVYAATGGATKTTTVDMSNTYLAWAKRNLESNGFSGPEHELIQSDCLQWLKSPYNTKKYDLIFLDPPSFSTSKRMKTTFDVQKDHVDLIKSTLEHLKPNGLLIFSNNRRHFKLAREEFSDLKIEEISKQTLPKDFERNPNIHNCWRITKG